MSPDDTDVNIALCCLTLAANLRRLDSLRPERREAVLVEATALLELVAEVFFESDVRGVGN